MSIAQRTILTPTDHGLILHLDGRGFVSIAQRVNGSWQERGVPIVDLAYFLRHLEPAFDSYISQNRFHSPCRRIAYLVQADALFSDLDYYNTEFGRYDPRYVLDFALTLLDDANIPAPTFATSTGRGLALVWLITPIPRRALPRWRACQEVIFEVLKPLGADPNARDAARVLRLVGTRNSRSGTLVETISAVGEIWDFDTLATEILPVARDIIGARRRRRIERDGHPAVAPASFTAATLWARRLDDFQKLITHRYGSLRLPSGQRDLLMLLCSIGMSYLVPGPEQLRREIYTIAGDICGWPEHETQARLSSVFSRTEKAFHGERVEYLGGERDPRYRYKDATMVEMLGVTEQEMRVLGLRHLISEEIKREHDRDRKRETRRATGVVPRETTVARRTAELVTANLALRDEIAERQVGGGRRAIHRAAASLGPAERSKPRRQPAQLRRRRCSTACASRPGRRSESGTGPSYSIADLFTIAPPGAGGWTGGCYGAGKGNCKSPKKSAPARWPARAIAARTVR